MDFDEFDDILSSLDRVSPVGLPSSGSTTSVSRAAGSSTTAATAAAANKTQLNAALSKYSNPFDMPTVDDLLRSLEQPSSASAFQFPSGTSGTKPTAPKAATEFAIDDIVIDDIELPKDSVDLDFDLAVPPTSFDVDDLVVPTDDFSIDDLAVPSTADLDVAVPSAELDFDIQDIAVPDLDTFNVDDIAVPSTDFSVDDIVVPSSDDFDANALTSMQSLGTSMVDVQMQSRDDISRSLAGTLHSVLRPHGRGR